MSSVFSQWFGRALQFYGSGSAVVTHSSMTLIFPLTIEAWVRLDSYIPSGNRYIYRFNSGSFRPQVFITTGLNLVGVVTNGGCGTYVATTSNFPITLGVRTHVAMTHPSSSVVNLYINGVFAGTGGGGGGLNCTAASTYIGSDTTGTAWFPGVIDKVRVSNFARYTGDFVPAASPFTSDRNTRLLVHFDNLNSADPTENAAPLNSEDCPGCSYPILTVTNGPFSIVSPFT
ncbi:MAG: LamG domain-containing protein [Xanthomonadaceae bacterium]|nr:LamG domain-containing protein [Xanthomonadaceae bacterium]